MSEFSVFSLILVIHVILGTVALLSLWIPFVAKEKGGKLHRRSGWVFTISMGGVGISAWALSACRLFSPNPALPPGDNEVSAFFLAYIGLISSTAVWMGIRSVRLKARRARQGHWLDILLPSLLFVAAILLGGLLGVARGEALGLVFSLIGLATAVPQLNYWLRTSRGERDWVVQHLSSMGTGAISAVTAFTVVNINALGLSDYALVVWIAPGVIFGTLISLAARSYRRAPIEAPRAS